jgi:hypothetical protein
MSAHESDAGPAFSQLPAGLREWLILERFHLHKPHLYQRRELDASFDISYLPQHSGTFRLPCFLIARRNLHMFGSQQQHSYSMQFYSDSKIDDAVLFPMHPLALDDYREFLLRVGATDAAREGVCIWAVPTSSLRTLLAWPDGAADRAVFVKTSLVSPVVGDRRVHRMRAGRSVALSALVANQLTELPTQLSYLRESFAFAARSAPHSGSIIRCIPQEIISGHVRVAPLFSLIGGEGERRPLLLAMLERAGTPPLQFVDEMLCKPVARFWLELCMRFGLIIEAHGQDLLLELSTAGQPTGRFYYRDFEGMQVDWELRRRLGYSAPDALAHSWQWREAYDTWENFPYGALPWRKWYVSLYQFLRMVLREVEQSLRQWHQDGLINGPLCGPDELTMAFSRHMFEGLERIFGVRVDSPYNIDRHLNRFLLLLSQLRRQALATVGTSLRRHTDLAA